jgi:hypothetical protein
MMDKATLRELRRQVGRILLEQWDPIGVADEPMATDEYEGYVYGVLRLLLDSAPASAIANHLAKVERERMGMHGVSSSHHLAVANALRALPIPVDGSRPSV